MRNSYRVRKAAAILEDRRDERIEELDEKSQMLREILYSPDTSSDQEDLGDNISDKIDELREERSQVWEESLDKVHGLLNDRTNKDGPYDGKYVFPFGMAATPFPERVDHNYDLDWSVGELEDIPDLSDFEQVRDLLEQGRGIDWLAVFAKTDSGRIHSFSENFNTGKSSMNRVYRELGLLLAENDITLSNGKYIDEQDLKEAGIIESGRYRQAWDVIYGRPDSVLHMGDGIITFNDTEFSFPWTEKVYFREEEYGDITSYEGGEFDTVTPKSQVETEPEFLRPPVDILRKSWLTSNEAMDLFSKGQYNHLNNLVRKGAERDDFEEQPEFDSEEFPEPGSINPNDFS